MDTVEIDAETGKMALETIELIESQVLYDKPPKNVVIEGDSMAALLYYIDWLHSMFVFYVPDALARLDEVGVDSRKFWAGIG